MKFCTISDLHIKQKGDFPSQLLERFIGSEEVKGVNQVYFLGDIFDFMVGGHVEYLEKYDFFFDIIEGLIKSGKHVYYLEGNHDFHLDRIMQNFAQNLGSNQTLFTHSKESIFQNYNSKKFLFTHGHEIDQNKSYQNWKKIYSSFYFKFLVNNILPYKVVENLGNRASANSKQRGVKKFIYNKNKELYRQGAHTLIKQYSLDFLIAGHTHISECYEIEKSFYVNNGFPQTSGQFIYFDSNEIHLKTL